MRYVLIIAVFLGELNDLHSASKNDLLVEESDSFKHIVELHVIYF